MSAWLAAKGLTPGLLTDDVVRAFVVERRTVTRRLRSECLPPHPSAKAVGEGVAQAVSHVVGQVAVSHVA